MNNLTCDVLVVGAGPAGLSAAYSLAKAGKKVICIDKKEKIGEPVRCAEGIGSYLFNKLPFKIPKNLLEWRIDGLKFNYSDLTITRKGGQWAGFSINRTIFENWLLKKAVDNNATIWTNSSLSDLNFDSNFFVSGAKIKKGNKLLHVFPKVIVAADGVFSKTAELLKIPVFEEIVGDILVKEIKSNNLKNIRFEQIFIGDFSPSGYGFIFPKSNQIANIGVGSIFHTKNMDNYFSEFKEINSVSTQLKDFKILKDKSKTSAFGSRLKKWIYGNVFFVGDAANQNYKPFVEGFIPAIVCGNLLGDYISKNTFYSDLVYKNLIYSNLFGFDYSDSLKEEMLKVFKLDEKKQYPLLFSLSSGLFTPFEISRLIKKSPELIMKEILNKI
ncbi:MAG: NAD(P)/FAD-dependent oxidoreductase [Candidatus Diapherotrites archaeon]|nr:NAD(P)/FAD-dependent oxidoreductase [Candidatus Diapherotrites archaeon]